MLSKHSFGSRYFSAYFVGILAFFSATHHKIHILRCVYWTYDQYPILHQWKASRKWGKKLINFMTSLKKQPVCILVKTDEVGCTTFWFLTMVHSFFWRLTGSFIWFHMSRKTKRHLVSRSSIFMKKKRVSHLNWRRMQRVSFVIVWYICIHPI